MKRSIIILLIISLLVIGLVASSYWITSIPTSYESTTVTSFNLSSKEFSDGQVIPTKYTCDGLDVSPPLQWEGYPPDTKSFVLIMEDLDAPAGIFTHWLIYNIPGNIDRLEEGVVKIEKLPNGIMQGINDFKEVGYGGPCPPPGKPHRYIFRMYALDELLDLKPRLSKQELLNSIKNHIIGTAELSGIYSR
ncbi:MAG: YbhB/YbcL family Raf kinase inhibitor-like protein [Nitrososphaerota archaeon]